MATRNEPASPRKLRQARDIGDYPSSPQLAQALTLGASLCVLPSLVHVLWTKSGDRLKAAVAATELDIDALAQASRQALVQLTKYCLPFLVAVALAKLVVKLVEARGFAGSGATGTTSHLGHRSRGFARFFDVRAVLNHASSLVVALVVSTCSFLFIRNQARPIAATLGTVSGGTQYLCRAVLHLTWFAFYAWAAVGLGSFAVAHRLWLSRQRMSQAEKRLEQKETEGDPLILSERAKTRQRNLAESSAWSLSEASLVIHGARRVAVVLHYDPAEVYAPRLLGVGTADLAAIIIAEAQRYEIPVLEYPSLAQALAQGIVGDPIAETHYASTAEAISEALTLTRGG